MARHGDTQNNGKSKQTAGQALRKGREDEETETAGTPEHGLAGDGAIDGFGSGRGGGGGGGGGVYDRAPRRRFACLLIRMFFFTNEGRCSHVLMSMSILTRHDTTRHDTTRGGRHEVEVERARERDWHGTVGAATRPRYFALLPTRRDWLIR